MNSDPLAQLRTHFSRYFALDDAEYAAVCERATVRRVKRRGFLLQEGEVCRHYLFVAQGCLRMYQLDRNGVEHILQFAIEQDWLVDIGSFYHQWPSSLFIEALEDTTVVAIAREDLLHLYTHYPKIDHNFRVIIEEQFMDLQQRMLHRNAASAQERYAFFLARYPVTAGRVPGQHIARYLGITPESLSRLRTAVARREGT